jgi:hypothetical protein
MMPHSKVSLKSVATPLAGTAFISAPPVLNASDHTTDFCCATCNTVLMHAEADQVFGLTIRCTNCGAFNTTDI